MRVRRSARLPFWLGPTDVAVVLVLIVSGSATASTALHGGDGARSPIHPAEAPSGPNLSVDPSEAWVLAGATVILRATWTGLPIGCTGAPAWFRWGIENGSIEGVVESSGGPTSNFTAETGESGRAQIVVRSAFLLECQRSQQWWTENASSNVTVDAPPSIENLTLTPNPVPVGSATYLSATLLGGNPPYLLRIAWGDGNVSVISVPAPGPISALHRFSSGTFVPRVVVTDADGVSANRTASTPLAAGTGTAIAIMASSSVTGIGSPVDFSGTILQPPPSFGYAVACSDALDFALTNSSAGGFVNFTCAFARPGTANISFIITPNGDDLPSLETEFTESVTAPLSVNASAPPGTFEVDQPLSVTAEVSGGVAPFRLVWFSSWNASSEQTNTDADGPVALPVGSDPTDEGTVTVVVADAVGAMAIAVVAGLRFDDPLETCAEVNRTLTPTGADVDVRGEIAGGVPPLDWWVVPEQVPESPDWATGVLASDGSFVWNSTLAEEGNDTFEITVVDRDGDTWAESVSASLVPALNVTTYWNESSNGTEVVVVLVISIVGGLPPFVANLLSSDLESWNCTAFHDGTFVWRIATRDSGSVVFSLVVHDATGAVGETNATLEFPPSNDDSGSPPSANASGTPPASSPNPPAAPSTASRSPFSSEFLGAAAGGAAAFLALVGVAFVLLRRGRQDGPGPKPALDPVAVIRGIVEPAEGAERSSVEILAEEEGVPAAVARATIDRLIDSGTLRAETGDDGEEVLAWSGVS